MSADAVDCHHEVSNNTGVFDELKITSNLPTFDRSDTNWH